MSQFLMWLRETWDRVSFEVLYVASWGYLFPEFVQKVLFCMPALLRDLVLGWESPPYLSLCWSRYIYRRVYFVAGLMEKYESGKEELVKAQRECSAWIAEIDDLLGALYV